LLQHDSFLGFSPSCYNKPNGCSATRALAPGPDHHHQEQQELTLNYNYSHWREFETNRERINKNSKY
jgi:hypothetical protein